MTHCQPGLVIQAQVSIIFIPCLQDPLPQSVLQADCGMHTHFSYSTSNPSRDQTDTARPMTHINKKDIQYKSHCEHKLTGGTQYIRYIKKTLSGRKFQGLRGSFPEDSQGQVLSFGMYRECTPSLLNQPLTTQKLTIKTGEMAEECAEGVDVTRGAPEVKEKGSLKIQSIPHWRISIY